MRHLDITALIAGVLILAYLIVARMPRMAEKPLWHRRSARPGQPLRRKYHAESGTLSRSHENGPGSVKRCSGS
jgi:hypothetical protein